MNSEQNVPEASAPQAPPPVSSENGQSTAPGQGTSRSSRRRRRRRKSKTGDAVAAPAEGQIVIQSGEDSDFVPQPRQPQASSPQGQSQGQGQNSPSAKRWKKKQRRRERQRTGGEYSPGNQIEPGNSVNGSNGFARRKQKPKGPRSFVGPMDHSYREANGNYAETSPSTMEMNGNTRGGHSKQRRNYDFEGGNIDRLPPELRAPVTTTVIREDAPTHIYFFVDDLFLTAKINEAARKLGVKVAFSKNDPEQLAQLFSGEEHTRPALIVFDLNNTAAKPLTLIPKIRTKLKRKVSILGFLSVLQGDLKAKATEVGCDTVMPKAAFSQNLPNLLRRYGAEEDEEPNFNQ
ncbi:response regulator [Terriglobus tenax]|uniref:response regulator n=1 Tax=Terriglobus tenax TaxID=1111115 RepID=UPI0021DFE3DF|nr:response regulator [Terriglobus tenax]